MLVAFVRGGLRVFSCVYICVRARSILWCRFATHFGWYVSVLFCGEFGDTTTSLIVLRQVFVFRQRYTMRKGASCTYEPTRVSIVASVATQKKHF